MLLLQVPSHACQQGPYAALNIISISCCAHDLSKSFQVFFSGYTGIGAAFAFALLNSLLQLDNEGAVAGARYLADQPLQLLPGVPEHNEVRTRAAQG